MHYFKDILILLPMTILCCQLYAFTVSRQKAEKQSRCQILGVLYMTIGVVTLVFHNIILVLTGFVLIMLGLRLMAYSLDRIDKKVFIDRYNEDL